MRSTGRRSRTCGSCKLTPRTPSSQLGLELRLATERSPGERQRVKGCRSGSQRSCWIGPELSGGALCLAASSRGPALHATSAQGAVPIVAAVTESEGLALASPSRYTTHRVFHVFNIHCNDTSPSTSQSTTKVKWRPDAPPVRKSLRRTA